MDGGPTGRATLKEAWRRCSTLWRPAGRRSPTTAALLNLTALGVGYAYLGAWWRAFTHGLTTLLIVVGFVVGAGRARPWVWMALFTGWAMWMAYDGWRQGRRLMAQHRVCPPLRPASPVIIPVVLIAAILAGCGQYLEDGDRAFAAALVAHRGGDCEAAKTDYYRATILYEWTFSSNIGVAEANMRECDAFLAATRFQENREFDKAIAAYGGYLETYRDGLLVSQVTERLALTNFDYASVLVSQGKVPDAIAKYVLILRRYRMTTVAQQVPEAIIKTYDDQVAPYYERHYCNVLRTLEYFASLSGDETSAVVEKARVLRPFAMFACGLDKVDARKADEARAQFETLKTAYPGSPLADVVDKAKIAGADRQADWLAIIVDWATVAAVVAGGVTVACSVLAFLPCAVLFGDIAVVSGTIAFVGRVVLAFRDCLPDFSAECESRISALLPTLRLPARLGPRKPGSGSGSGSSPPKTESPSAPQPPGGR